MNIDNSLPIFRWRTVPIGCTLMGQSLIVCASYKPTNTNDFHIKFYLLTLHNHQNCANPLQIKAQTIPLFLMLLTLTKPSKIKGFSLLSILVSLSSDNENVCSYVFFLQFLFITIINKHGRRSPILSPLPLVPFLYSLCT